MRNSRCVYLLATPCMFKLNISYAQGRLAEEFTPVIRKGNLGWCLSLWIVPCLLGQSIGRWFVIAALMFS